MVKKGRDGNMSVLDDELLVQILCRLGGSKYAVQCKLVCKLWCSTIDTTSSDSRFMRRWRQINNKEEGNVPPVFVTQYSYDNESGYEYRHSVDCNTEELPSLDLNFMPSYGPICILSSSKDLLLCCPYPYDHSCYYICNPFTKQWTTLPPPPSAQQMREPWVFKDIKVGFIVHDHDHGRDINFTVLRIVPYNPCYNKVHIFVFSSEGGGWRQFMDGSCNTRMFLVHYKGMLSSFQYDPLGQQHLRIGFKVDAAGGSVTRFVFPPNPEPDAQFLCRSVIGVCRGVLRLAELVRRPLTLVVWQLYDGCERRQEWEMVQELDIKEMAAGSEDCDMVRCYYGHEPHKVDVFVLAFHPHDRDILYLCFSVPPGDNPSVYIFSCHLKKRRLELLRAFTTTRIQYDVYDVPPRCPQLGFFSIVPPCWPTPVPRLQSHASHQRNC